MSLPLALRFWATGSEKYKAAATENAVSVCPDGMDALYSTSPTIRSWSWAISAAGRGLSRNPLPSRANSIANGAEHNQAQNCRGAQISSGAVSASRPQALPSKENPVHSMSGKVRHQRLMCSIQSGSVRCNHKGALRIRPNKGSHQTHPGIDRAVPLFMLRHRCHGRGWLQGRFGTTGPTGAGKEIKISDLIT